MLSIITLLLIATPPLPPETAPAEPAKVTLAAEEVSVPLSFFHNRPVVEVRINGAGPYEFILDTGAGGGSVLNAGLSKELDLPVRGKVQLMSPGGSRPMDADVVGIETLEIGGIRISNGTAQAADLSGALGVPGMPRGVLSIADLKDLLLTIDYPGKRLIVSRGSLPEPDGRDVLAYEYLQGLPAVPVEVAGKIYTLHMDTGSPSGVTLPVSSIGGLPLESEPVEVGRAHMVDREVVIRGARLDGKVRFGPLEMDHPRITFLEGVDVGNVGNEILQKFAITMDQKTRRLRLSGPVKGAEGS